MMNIDPAEIEISPLDRILGEYLSRTDAGEDVPLEQFLEAHADLRDEFMAFLQADSLARGLAEGRLTSDETLNGAPVDTASPQRRLNFPLVNDPLDAGEDDAHDAQPQLLPGPYPVPFGTYRIVGLLGQGAMGEVYVGEDARLRRKVALKMPRRQVIAQPELLARFLREARASAGLRHHNLCPIYEVNTTDGIPYIAMAFIDGKPLTSLIGKHHQHSPIQVAVTIRKVAQALEVAHRAGVVHRDLKPANILIDADGEPIVMDFGLARQAEEEGRSRLTVEGMILGTPSYMSPEQVRSEHARVGPTSDIYSLGVILFEWLTGELPFPGPMMSMLVDVANDAKPPPKLSAIRPDIPEPLESICLRMLAKSPPARFQSMKEVAAALTAWLETANDLQRGLQTVAQAIAAPARDVPSSDLTVIETSTSSIVRPDLGDSGSRQPAARFRSVAFGGLAVALLLGVIVITIRNRDGSTRTIEADADAEISIVRQPDANGPAESKPQRPTPADITDDPDRRAALWLQKIGVGFQINSGEGVLPSDPLPDKPFRIFSIGNNPPGLNQFGDDLAEAVAEPLRGIRVTHFGPPDRFTAVGMEKMIVLPEFSGLSMISFPEGTLDDQMLVPLSKLQQLTNLGSGSVPRSFTGQGLSGCKGLTDLTLPSLKKVEVSLVEEIASLPKLNYVNLSGSPCGPEAAAALARLRLYKLVLGNCRVDDAAAAELAKSVNLKVLTLPANPLTDTGLAEFHRMKQLQELDIQGTQVTAEGVAALKAALPDCKVEWEIPVPQPTPTPKPMPKPTAAVDDLDRRAAIWLLKEGATLGVDPGPDLRPEDPLPDQPFRITRIHAERTRLERFGDGLADALREPLQGTRVTTFFMPESVTAVGLEKLVVLPEFSALKGINMFSDTLDDQMVVALSKLPNLGDINAYSPTDHFTGKGLSACRGLTDLTLINLPRVTPTLMEELRQLPKIQYLNLSGSPCDTEQVSAVARLPLRLLHFNRAKIDDAVVAKLANCTTLEVLGLTENPITDQGLAELHRLKRLRELSLKNTQVTAQGVAALKAALPDCEVEFP